jgi:hypothetical protein
MRGSRSGRPPASPRLAAADRSLEALALLLCVACLALLLPGYREFFHDDSYITLRYVARWLAGRGLGWNDGEFVEGYTHPLWLLQIAGLSALGVEPVAAARALGVGYAVAFLGAWWLSGASWLFALVVVTLPGWLLWAWGGLETVSFGFWLVVAAAANESALRRAAPDRALPGLLAGLGFAAAALTRPEGFGVGAIAVALVGLARRGRVAAWMAVGLLVPCALYLGFRLTWFGDALPNPAHAKLGGLPLSAVLRMGAIYLWETRSLWAPALAAWLAAVALLPGGPFRLDLLALGLAASLLLTGGDHMPGARFAVPAVVLLALAAGQRIRRLSPPRKVVAAACVAAAVAAQLMAARELPRVRDPAARVGERVGRYLAAQLPAGALVAAASAGATPYYAPELVFVDTLGLNDRHIARRAPVSLETRWQLMPGHRKGDGRYVLAREPDVVILGPAEGYLGDPARAWFLTDFELVRDPEFHARYRPYRFALPDPRGAEPVALTAYLRVDSVRAEWMRREGTLLEAPRVAPKRR